MRVAIVELGPSRPELHEPIGIETLAGYLSRELPSIQLQLISVSMDADTLQEMPLNGFDVVGIAAKLGTFERLKRLVTELNTGGQSNDPLLVIGDLLGTYAYNEILQIIPTAICVLGEGELGFAGLLRRLIEEGRSADLTRVPNLAFLRAGRPFVTHREVIAPENIGPPLRDFLYKAITLNSQVQIEGSRGCPWSKCSFCSIPSLNGNAWRPFPLKSILEQIANISEAGGRSIYFTDSDFLGSSLARSLQFARLLNEWKGRRTIHPALNFYINLQVTGIIGGAGNTAAECSLMLDELHGAGLREVFVGIESGDKSQVKRYAKASSPNRNALALTKLRELGLQSDVGFIMFDPNMRLSDLEHNLDFIKSAGLGEHPSRLTKALRIQPGTGYASKFFGKNLPTMVVNNLCYPYRFADRSVQLTYDRFRKWELQHLDFETLVQGCSKGEVPDEATRVSVRSYLGRLRSIDLTFLEACTFASRQSEFEANWLTDLERRLRDALNLLIQTRPKEINIYAARLGIALDEGFTSDRRYIDRYRTLNVYEDPVDLGNDEKVSMKRGSL